MALPVTVGILRELHEVLDRRLLVRYTDLCPESVMYRIDHATFPDGPDLVLHTKWRAEVESSHLADLIVEWTEPIPQLEDDTAPTPQVSWDEHVRQNQRSYIAVLLAAMGVCWVIAAVLVFVEHAH